MPPTDNAETKKEINPASAFKLKIKDRRLLALEFRKLGASYRKIAQEMRQRDGVSPKYSEATAHNDVMMALKELNEKFQDAADEVLRLEIERLDDLWTVYYPRAKKADGFAFQICLQIMNRRAKFLGLDTPQKVDVTSGGMSAFDIEKWKAERAERLEFVNDMDEPVETNPVDAPTFNSDDETEDT